MASSSKNAIDMTSGPLLGKLLLFSLPLMASSILQLMFNAADIIVVGRFCGDNSLAAVGSNGSLVALIVSLFMGLSVGTNVLVARYLGAKQDRDVEETVHTSILISILSGIFLTFIGVIFAPEILALMSSPPEVIGLATIYLRVFFLGMTAQMLYNFGAAILRAIGDTRRPLIYLTVAGVINVLLNLFFVIALRMDVAGVALATIISQIISAVLVIRCLTKENGPIRLDLRALKIYPNKLKWILRIGLPASLQSIVFSISNVTIQASVNSFGAVVLAGNSAAANLESFVYTAMNAFYQASISFTSQCVGAGKMKRIDRILRTSLICVIITGLVMGQSFYRFGGFFLRLYSSSDEVIAAGIRRLSIISATYFLCGVMEVLCGVLRGLGHAILPMIVSLVGSCFTRMFWIFTFFRMERFHTVKSLYWTYPVSWIITLGTHYICFLIIRHRLKDRWTGE